MRQSMAYRKLYEHKGLPSKRIRIQYTVCGFLYCSIFNSTPKELSLPHGHHHIITGLTLLIRDDTSVHGFTVHSDGLHAFFHIIRI